MPKGRGFTAHSVKNIQNWKTLLRISYIQNVSEEEGFHMRKYFCDVCGSVIPDGQQQELEPGNPLVALCPQIKDLCPKCAKAGQSILSSLGNTVLAAWQKELSKSPDNALPPPINKGSSGRSKKPVPGQQAPTTPTDVAVPPPAVPKKKRGRPPKSSYNQTAADMNAPTSMRQEREKREAPDSPASTSSAGTQDIKAADSSGPAGEGKAQGSACDSRKKRETLERLQKYRTENGLGCLTALAKKADITVDRIRDLLAATPQKLEVWEKIANALDALGV